MKPNCNKHENDGGHPPAERGSLSCQPLCDGNMRQYTTLGKLCANRSLYLTLICISQARCFLREHRASNLTFRQARSHGQSIQQPSHSSAVAFGRVKPSSVLTQWLCWNCTLSSIAIPKLQECQIQQSRPNQTLWSFFLPLLGAFLHTSSTES